MKSFLLTKFSISKIACVLVALGAIYMVSSNKVTIEDLALTAVEKQKIAIPHNCNQHSSLAMMNDEEKKEQAKKLVQSALQQKLDNWSQDRGISTCWAEDTPPAYIENFMKNASASFAGTELANSLNTSFGGGGGGKFQPRPRWFFTANLPLASGVIPQGECFVLTWSIVPDGTSIFGFNGEATSNSQLVAYLDGVYGCTSTADLTQSCWFSLFTSVFDDWASKTGVMYEYVGDDGAPFTSTPPYLPDGLLGVRGDVRISGHPIDGPGGILAYNFFPGPFLDDLGGFIQGGDMVIDMPDLFYTISNPATFGTFDLNNSRRFRNVVAHEHGHGLGLSHSCPLDGGSKLMEPFASLMPAHDGAQEDDYTGVNAMYGDKYCNSVAPHNNSLIDFASIDNSTEVDEFTFEVPRLTTISITLTPTGTEYLAGPQDGSVPGDPAGCSAGTPYDALRQANLDMELVDPSGAVIATAAAAGVGLDEVISALELRTQGVYTIRVKNNGEAQVQMYKLACSISTVPIPTMSQWGLLIFGLLILNLGVVFVYKQENIAV